MKQKINYSALLQNASISVVKKILEQVSDNGFDKEQHLYITFSLKHPSVKISDALKSEFGDEITIVLQYEFWDLKVDDYGFGGGKGMVLMPQPIFDAVESIRDEESMVILLTPQGKQYNQVLASKLSKEKHLIFICGHYEGFDERIRTLADMEISIGDYVLTGGEIPSMAITDSIVRLLDGVIQEESHEKDSFQDNLLDYPVYTKPVDFRGMKVPDVLLSGHHANINKWRYEQQLKRTESRRPDLLEKR